MFWSRKQETLEGSTNTFFFILNKVLTRNKFYKALMGKTFLRCKKKKKKEIHTFGQNREPFILGYTQIFLNTMSENNIQLL